MKTYRAKKGSRLAAEKREERKKRITGMHTTQPIIEGSMIRKWLDIAKDHDAHRYRGGPSWYLLLVLGFNTGLRISDLVQLRVRDIRGREDFAVEEGKTGKERQIHLKRNVCRVITEQLRDMDPDDFALQSRQPDSATGQKRGISRQRAYEIVKTIAKAAGYEQHVGCHTMRKTYAWSMYDASGENLALVQKTLNHSSQAMTMHYIGLDQREINETINRMRNMI